MWQCGSAPILTHGDRTVLCIHADITTAIHSCVLMSSHVDLT